MKSQAMARGSILALLGITLVSSLAAAGPAVRVGPVSVNGPAAGVFVENNGASPITAFLIKVTAFENGKRRAVEFKYLDIYINFGHDEPVAAGERHFLPLILATESAKYIFEASLEGVILADGSHSGNAAGLAILTGRRSFFRKCVEDYKAIALRYSSLPDALTAAAKERDRYMAATGLNSDPEVNAAIRQVGTLLYDWFRASLHAGPEPSPESCPECTRQKMAGIVGGLSRWGASAERGNAELNR